VKWSLLLLALYAGALRAQERTTPTILTGPERALDDSLMTDVQTPPAYEANMYIGDAPVGDRLVAHWLDNFGGWWSGTLGYARRAGANTRRTAITLVFDYPDGLFHTTFTLGDDQSTWSVLMQDRAPGGSWREFAHYAVRRRTG